MAVVVNCYFPDGTEVKEFNFGKIPSFISGLSKIIQSQENIKSEKEGV